MKIEHLQYVLGISQSKSISMAAQKLFIGQTTLSSIVRSIEKEIGANLFVRTNAGVHLTDEGAAALPLIQGIVDQYSDLISMFSKQSLENTVNFTTYNSMCLALGQHLSQWSSEASNDIILSIQEAKYYEIVNCVLQGKSKIAIGADIDGRHVWRDLALKNNLQVETLSQDRYYLVTRSDSPFSSMDRVWLEDLYGEHLAAAQGYPQSFTAPYDRIISDQTLKRFRKVTLFATNEQIKTAVETNGMISIMLGIAPGRRDRSSGKLRYIPLGDFNTEITNFLLWDSSKGLSSAEENLLGYIRRLFPDPNLTEGSH